MKVYIQVVTMLCMLFMGIQVSFAGFLGAETGVHKEDIYNADAMLEIKTLAIADALYQKVEETEPDKGDLMDIIYNASKEDKEQILTYISYRDVCGKIKELDQIDVLRLDRGKGKREYKNHIAKYADAYLEVTVSNDTRLNIFYDVYDAKTHEVIYTYRKLMPKGAVRDSIQYESASKDFYKDFLLARNNIKLEKEKEQ